MLFKNQKNLYKSRLLSRKTENTGLRTVSLAAVCYIQKPEKSVYQVSRLNNFFLWKKKTE